MSALMAASLNPYITQFDVTFDAEKSPKYGMTIQLALGGFSFAILDTSNRSIVGLEFYQSGTLLDSVELFGGIIKALEANDLSQRKFSSVTFIVDDRINTLVPKALFDEEASASYLDFSFNTQEAYKILTDEIAESGCVNVYALPMSLYSKLSGRWPEARFIHASTVFVRSIVGTASNSIHNVLIQVRSRNFDLAITENGKLRFFNNFRFNTKEDFVYFLLFAFEQQQLSGLEVPVRFSGLIQSASDIIELCDRYISDIKFVGSDMELKVATDLAEFPFHYYYIHYQTLKCES